MDHCFVYLRKTVPFQLAREALTNRGFQLDPRDGAVAVRRDDIAVSLAVYDAPLATASRLPHACSLRRCAQCFDVAIADLAAVLDEANTLIDLQLTLQSLGEAYLVTAWNGQVSAPERKPHGSLPKLWSAALRGPPAAVMKGAGFAKKGNTFTRSLGTADQRVTFQKSRSTYRLDVGWDLEEVSALGGQQVRTVVGGLAVTFAMPVVPDPIQEWSLTLDTSVDDLSADVRDELGRIVAALDRIDGPRGMLESVDLEEGFRKLHRAQLRHVLGDSAGARADVLAVCEEFSDRKGMEPDQVFARLGLPS